MIAQGLTIEQDTPADGRGDRTIARSAAPRFDRVSRAHTPLDPNERRIVLFKIANRAQCAEIVKHRDHLSGQLGRQVSLDDAARDWIRTRAAQWREAFDSGRI